MGKFTGKSDFQDWCEMHNTPEKIVKDYEVYINGHKINISKVQDLVPYYPYIMSVMASSDGKGTVHLSSLSYFDEEEKQSVELAIEAIVAEYKRAKREKRPVSRERVESECYRHELIDQISKIIDERPEILKFPYKMNEDWASREKILSIVYDIYFTNVHTHSYNRMREDFLKFCAEQGFKDYLKIWLNIDYDGLSTLEKAKGVDNQLLCRIGQQVYYFHTHVLHDLDHKK